MTQKACFPSWLVLKQQRAMQPAANNLSSVLWHVSDPAVIPHDSLSELGPGQAESRDQPLFCFVCPFQHAHDNKDRQEIQRTFPVSVYSPLLLIKMPLFFPRYATGRTCFKYSSCKIVALSSVSFISKLELL